MGIKKSSKLFSNKKRRTYLRMLKSIIGAFIIIIIILIVLQLLGINVSSMLAGVGIASIIVGFALQDAMKDIFRGLEIVADDYYDIGDVIKFNDNFGQVLSINLRTTRIQDINTMNIVSIANRNIDKVEVSTGYIYLPVPFPLRIKPSAADEIMQEIGRKRGCLARGGYVDYEKVCSVVMNDLKNGYISGITFDKFCKKD